MKKKLIKVEIDRKKWYRGKGGEFSRLRLRSGKQCCLGFACRSLGLKAADILEKEYPATTGFRLISGLTNERGDDTSFSSEAAIINDKECINDKQRERELKVLAKENGFNFVFVG